MSFLPFYVFLVYFFFSFLYKITLGFPNRNTVKVNFVGRYFFLLFVRVTGDEEWYKKYFLFVLFLLFFFSEKEIEDQSFSPSHVITSFLSFSLSLRGENGFS